MNFKQFDICIADLNPRFGTETGKTRPVVIIQTDLLNTIHPSTLICPITTNVKAESEILRAHLKKGTANLKENCDMMPDQIRVIDNKRLLKKIGSLPPEFGKIIKRNISIILDIEAV